MARRLLALVSVLLLFTPACAHGPASLAAGGPGGRPFAASPSDLLAAGEAAGRPDDAQTTILFEGVRFDVDAQGRTVWDVWRVLQVHTRDAVRHHGILRVGFEPWFQAKPTIEARVVTPDGKVHRLDPSTISERADDDNDSEEIDDSRSLEAPLPAVAPGAVIEEHIQIRDTEPRDPGSAFGRYFIGDEEPVQATRVEVDVPASAPFHFHLAGLPMAHPVVTTEGTRRRLVLDVGPMKAISDVESNAPGDVVQWPYLAFSTGRSWAAIASGYSAIVEKQIAGAHLEAEVSKVVAGATTRKARIDRILEKLSSRVRYTGVELGDAAIVPRTPAETLARGFGDCKDKATLLVAWLRAAGIGAHVALLSVGEARDVDPRLPALGDFDHAIVYVPGKPALWIDPTDRYRPAGSLPNSDDGRLALVAAPGTTKLLKTPPSRSKDNVFLDRRDMNLVVAGWSKMTLHRTFTGSFAASYRSMLTEGSHEKVHHELENFVKHRFQAKALDDFTHSALGDLAKPVDVTLTMDQAGRGRSTALRDAVAAVQDHSLFDFLPDFLSGPADATAPERTYDLVLDSPYVAIVRYRIVPPPGYVARTLPPDDGFHVGPATFHRHFSKGPGQVVNVVERFDTGTGRFTPHQARLLHLKVSAEMGRAPRLVYFDLLPSRELMNGKAKKAFADYRRLAKKPMTALGAARIADGLDRIGLGDLARDYAHRAVEIGPKDPFAWRILGRVLSRDRFGRVFHRGFDRAGAIAAYKHAASLTEDSVADQNLAALYERSPDATVFGKGCDLGEAVHYLKAAQKISQVEKRQLALIAALIHAKRYAEAAKLAEAAPASNRRNILLLVSIGLKDGLAALQSRANQLAGDEGSGPILLGALGGLIGFRAYGLATALAKELGPDQVGPAVAPIFNGAHPLHVPGTTKPLPGALGLVAALVPHAASDGASDLRRWLRPRMSARIPTGDLDPSEFRLPGTDGLRLGSLTAKTPWLLGDLMAAETNPVKNGHVGPVYRVRLDSVSGGGGAPHFFLVKEAGSWRFLATDSDVAPLGSVALAQLDAGHLDAARTLLDWAVDGDVAAADQDLPANPFTVVWSKDRSDRGKQATRVAAVVLAALGPRPGKVTRELVKVLAKVPKAKKKRREAIELAYVYAESNGKHPSKAIAFAKKLAAAHEDKTGYQTELAWVLFQAKRRAALRRFLTHWHKKHPDEVAAVVLIAQMDEREGQLKAAAKLLQSAIDDGHEIPPIDNDLANLALFGAIDMDKGLKLARRATSVTNRNDADILNTLAVLQAQDGDASGAHKSLMDTLKLRDDGLPKPEDWYVIARIEDDLGFEAAAARDYARVRKVDDASYPVSYWHLAKERLGALKAKGVHPAPKPKHD